MTERQLSKVERKREKQPISVPFIWEIKPGTPKKDWKPNPNKPSPANSVSPPVKLVVSVPFGWEEKPGTPLQSIIMPCRNSEADNKTTDHDRVDHEHELINESSSSDSELETCSFKTSESFSSAMSNGLIQTTDLSKAVPVETGYMDTGSKRWVGASFLEWLFPLLVVPGLSLQDEVESREEEKGDASDHKEEDNVQVQELKLEGGNNNNRSVVARPLLTLGELIVMSRRRSIQKKIGKMKKQSSLDFMKRNGFGCCVFGAGVDGFVGLHRKWKRHLQLRLM